jgi:uncharacterized protein
MNLTQPSSLIHKQVEEDTMANVINWFEIPTKNFERACDFYGTILGGEIQKVDAPAGIKMGFLPGTAQETGGGALVKGEGYEPSAKGSIVYLNGGTDLSGPLAKVERSGGKVLIPKTSIGENGYMAHFLDTEGNRVALHSMK